MQRVDCTVFAHGLRQYERITRVIGKCYGLSVCVCFSVFTFLDLMVAYQAALSRPRTAFARDIHRTLIPCSTYGTLDVREQVEEDSFSCGLLFDFAQSLFGGVYMISRIPLQQCAASKAVLLFCLREEICAWRNRLARTHGMLQQRKRVREGERIEREQICCGDSVLKYALFSCLCWSCNAHTARSVRHPQMSQCLRWLSCLRVSCVGCKSSGAQSSAPRIYYRHKSNLNSVQFPVLTL